MRQPVVTYRSALILTSAFLTCIGLLAIYSSSSIPASQATGNEFFYVQKQACVAIAGFLFVFISGHLSFHWVERLTLPLLIVALVLLVMVHIPGLEGRKGGASRWIVVAGFSFQPAEIAKLALILFLAKNLSRPMCNIEKFRSGILPNVLVFAIFAGLLMIQPDFGTTALMFVVTFLMLFAAGLPQRYIAAGIAAAVAGVIGAVLVAPYRIARLLTFLDPWSQFKGGGFQIIQSYLGFQNGGLLGVGLGESRQKLFFLPEAHTDFILTVIGEELGLIGVLLICCLYLYLVYLGYKITSEQEVPYRKFLAFGLTSLIAFQAGLNMGVTMGVLPTKGITLPFVSNGSNSLIVFLFAIAILARISQEGPVKPNASASKQTAAT
jgi:cell division protein FtsW